MLRILPGFLLVLIYFQRGITDDSASQANSNNSNSCSSGYCSVEEKGPCEDDGEPKLYRWDPVKVCQLDQDFVYF